MPDWKPILRGHLDRLSLSPARAAEIIEELSLHLDERSDEHRRRGATPEQAARLALAELDDGVLIARLSELRQAHRLPPVVPGEGRRRWHTDLWQDLRYAARLLGQQPGFTAAAAITLALGIGANAAIFSLVNATLLQRLPIHDSERVLYVFNGVSGNSVFSYPLFRDIADGATHFEALAAWGGITVSLNADGTTDLVPGIVATGNFFDTLGVQAARGRVFHPHDDLTPGAHPVVVISDGLWQRRFGGRADIVDSRILVNGHAFTVIGVMPADFPGPQLGTPRDLYVPMMMQAVVRPPRGGYSGEMNPDLLQVRGNSWLFALGRLRPGITREQAESSLTAVATAADRSRVSEAPVHPITTQPIDDGMPGQREQLIPVAQLLLAIVGAVLLIACANVANLLLARASARRREVAVRLALGASRWRLIRQFLTESVLLSIVAAALGVALAWLVVIAFRAAPPPAGALPIALDFSIDWRVLTFTLSLAVATGLAFGIAPALRASQPALVPSLKDDGALSAESGRRVNLRKVLVVAEVAIALALLLSAGLFVRSLRASQSIATGFDHDRVVSVPLSVNLLRYTRDQGREFYQRAIDRARALPGVSNAAVARAAVLSGPPTIRSLQIDGRQNTDTQLRNEGGGFSTTGRNDVVAANSVSPGYFSTLGIPRRGGREFDVTDVDGAPLVVVVNTAFAERHFAGTTPLGARISISGPKGPWREVVGIVETTKYLSLVEAPMPMVFLPLAQNHETGVTLHVRTSIAPSALIPTLRREIQALDPNLPLPSIASMEDAIATSLYSARMGAWLLSVFGGLALLLAAVGVYGVLAYSVTRRTREIGIRVALGAPGSRIFRLVAGEGLWLVTIGIALGLIAAAFGSQLLSRFLFGVSATDRWTFLAAPVILGGVAIVACVVPARRALKVDPTTALRT